jgi:ParB-like chromosome segregation protein Spo0J
VGAGVTGTGDLIKFLELSRQLPAEERVAIYNAASAALGALVNDITPDPAVSPQLIPVGDIEGNDYNPNRAASTELDLLELSMREDGITMAIVVIRERKRHVVVDGFHRRLVAADRLGREYLPCAVIQSSLADRMASTVRHNRARGKHQVDLMATLVKEMMALGWDDEKIAENLGMSVEELLRLRQIAGAARMLASEEYTREWKVAK